MTDPTQTVGEKPSDPADREDEPRLAEGDLEVDPESAEAVRGGTGDGSVYLPNGKSC